MAPGTTEPDAEGRAGESCWWWQQAHRSSAQPHGGAGGSREAGAQRVGRIIFFNISSNSVNVCM